MSDLANRIMAVLDADPHTSSDLAEKAVALTECIARILVFRLSDDPVTARAIAECLTQRLIARISEGSVSSSEFLN